MKILIADATNVGTNLKRQLTDDRHTVDVITDGASAELAALNTPYDFIIMNVDLSVKDGLPVLKTLREEKCYTPVIMLSANETDAECIACLSAGADNYVKQSIGYDLLREHIFAIGRRKNVNYTEILTHREIEIDIKTHTVHFKGEICHLPLHEFKLLVLLMRNADSVMTRKMLQEGLYKWDVEITSNTLEVNIHHLRDKFGVDYIRTVRGVGYQLV